jgi:hypothetical protein
MDRESSIFGGINGPDLEIDTDLNLLLRLRMSGVIPTRLS